MVRFRRDYRSKILFAVGILFLFNNIGYSSDISKDTLKVPSIFQRERNSLRSYLGGNCIFHSEDETPGPFRADRELISDIPVDSRNRFVYRGMRLTINSLNEIICNGLKFQKRFLDPGIFFAVDPRVAAEYAFLPDADSYPTEDFLCVILQVDRWKSGDLIEDYDWGMCRANRDVPPEVIVNIFVFDRIRRTYVNITPLVTKVKESLFTPLTKVRGLLSNLVRFVRLAL